MKESSYLSLLKDSNFKVVPLTDVKNWIVEAREFVSPLPPEEAIIRLPTASMVQ